MSMIARGICALLVSCGVAGAIAAGSSAEQASRPGWAPAAQLDAGANFTCAIVTGSQVRCWGFGADGELGYPGITTVGASDTPASVGPVDIGLGYTAIAISSGNYHTCVIRNDGSVVCWGLGANGRLGYGNENNVGDTQTPGAAGPVNLGPHTAKAISAGGSHTCAILDDGSVRCWGYGADGALGNGGTNDVLAPSSVPVNLGPGRTAMAISAGGRHTCAILDNGSVLCWGNNDDGQLGYGNKNGVTDPSTVQPLDAIACPSAGQCTAVDNTGRRLTFNPATGVPTIATVDDVNTLTGVACPSPRQCTAVDNVGQQVTFNPTNPVSTTPTTIDLGKSLAGVACPPSTASQCTAVDNIGREMTFNPTTGTRTRKVVDTGNSLTGVACPARRQCTAVDNIGQRVTFDPTKPQTPSTMPVDSGNSLAAVTCPSTSSCTAVDTSGQQVTFDPNSTTKTPITNAVDSGHRLAAVACPSSTSLCTAVDSSGQQVTFDPNSTGPPTVTNAVDSGNSLTAVACPSTGSCTAVDSGGHQVTFDPNSSSTATPTTIDTVGPVNLGPGRTARAITAGANHTCAILDNGNVLCWGYGSDGELGRGDRSMVGDDETPGTAGPVDLGAGLTATAISAGANHTCAILADATVRCWGLGASGRLGYGNTSNIGDYVTPASTGPVDLGAGRTALAISAGARHTCAELDHGSVRCWGYGGNGQLGYCSVSSVGATETPGSAGPVNLSPGDGGALCPSAAGPPATATPGAPGTAARTVNPDAARARGYRRCLASVRARARHAKALTHRGSARERARARRRLAGQLAHGRKQCVKRWGRTPGRVTGLHAITRGQTKIELDFKAPGTNGKQPPAATTYLVKISFRPIRSRHAFASAPALCHSACRFTVKAVGGKIALTVTGLQRDTTYYLAVAALDNVTARPGPRTRTVKSRTG